VLGATTVLFYDDFTEALEIWSFEEGLAGFADGVVTLIDRGPGNCCAIFWRAEPLALDQAVVVRFSYDPGAWFGVSVDTGFDNFGTDTYRRWGFSVEVPWREESVIFDVVEGTEDLFTSALDIELVAGRDYLAVLAPRSDGMFQMWLADPIDPETTATYIQEFGVDWLSPEWQFSFGVGQEVVRVDEFWAVSIDG
jgi:hypothetical protein